MRKSMGFYLRNSVTNSNLCFFSKNDVTELHIPSIITCYLTYVNLDKSMMLSSQCRVTIKTGFL